MYKNLIPICREKFHKEESRVIKRGLILYSSEKKRILAKMYYCCYGDGCIYQLL